MKFALMSVFFFLEELGKGKEKSVLQLLVDGTLLHYRSPLNWKYRQILLHIGFYFFLEALCGNALEEIKFFDYFQFSLHDFGVTLYENTHETHDLFILNVSFRKFLAWVPKLDVQNFIFLFCERVITGFSGFLVAPTGSQSSSCVTVHHFTKRIIFSTCNFISIYQKLLSSKNHLVHHFLSHLEESQ